MFNRASNTAQEESFQRFIPSVYSFSQWFNSYGVRVINLNILLWGWGVNIFFVVFGIIISSVNPLNVLVVLSFAFILFKIDKGFIIYSKIYNELIAPAEKHYNSLPDYQKKKYNKLLIELYSLCSNFGENKFLSEKEKAKTRKDIALISELFEISSKTTDYMNSDELTGHINTKILIESELGEKYGF